LYVHETATETDIRTPATAERQRHYGSGTTATECWKPGIRRLDCAVMVQAYTPLELLEGHVCSSMTFLDL